jgi:hypothetical protein
MDQINVGDLFPAILIHTREHRKAYTFCLFTAHANSSNYMPVKKKAKADTWLWGPICSNIQVLHDPFELPSSPEYDDSEGLDPDSLSCMHLLAMALVKIIFYQTREKHGVKYQELLDKQPEMIDTILKNIHSRNPNILKAILNPRPLLSIYAMQDFPEDGLISTHVHDAVRIYSRLFSQCKGRKHIKRILKSESSPSYEMNFSDMESKILKRKLSRAIKRNLPQPQKPRRFIDYVLPIAFWFFSHTGFLFSLAGLYLLSALIDYVVSLLLSLGEVLCCLALLYLV